MKTTKNSAHTPKELLNDLRSLVSDTQTMATESLSEHTAEALDALRERYDAAQERFAELYEVAKKRAVEGAQQADATIRKHPYESLAIALGVGVVIGALISRRSR